MNNFLLTAQVKHHAGGTCLTYFWFESEEELRDAINDEQYSIIEVKETIEIISSRKIVITES